ncbi:hypothetical protein QQ045_030454 [Rhodiola kirilowii]
MDKSWMSLERCDARYSEGIAIFIDFVRRNSVDPKHLCPCQRCNLHRRKISLDEIYMHLIQYGMMRGYTTWTSHGEVGDGREMYALRQQYLMHRRGESSSQSQTDHFNPTMEILHDTFPYVRDEVMNDAIEFDHLGEVAYEKYQNLVAEAQTPIYTGSELTVLEIILKTMQAKVENRWSNKSLNDILRLTKLALPKENKYPDSYQDVKKVLKNLGLGYETIHACEKGCILYYKEFMALQSCPVCNEPRYTNTEGSKIPNRVVKYFPLTPRLQRLYMSPHTAKEMRWHGGRDRSDKDLLRHPADGEVWQNFDREFPEFAKDIRNVRLGLATDGFNPFGVSGLSHSTWPIIVMPYNFSPSMCMKKEFNILSMLISGPKSPGKCLNVFMRPLIDELKILWDTGVPTYDRHDGSSFMMKAAVLWTISDFPGLGMLGGIQTKGFFLWLRRMLIGCGTISEALQQTDTKTGSPSVATTGKNTKLSQRMSYARSKKINHHSGKILLARRAKRHLAKGHKAPQVASYGDAYAGEPAAAKIMEEMENKVRTILDEGGSSLDEPLSEEIQLAIISESVGEKKGTRISGAGKCFRKPPRPRGGAKVAAQTSQIREELIRAKEDSVKKDERILILEEKMRELEDLVRGGAGSNNISDGASCGMRRP